MLFNFDDMEETILHNFNGGKNDTKAKMFIDENVKILYGTLEPGSSIGLHTHEKTARQFIAYQERLLLSWMERRKY